MRSLTSVRKNRAYGLEKIGVTRSSDFFNSIGQEQTFAVQKGMYALPPESKEETERSYYGGNIASGQSQPRWRGFRQEAALGGFPHRAPRSWFSAWRRLASISMASASEGILDAI